jgi:uncharacterized membrane protein
MNDTDSVNVLTDLLFGSLYSLPGYVLVGFSCIVVGYIFKMIKRFPNDGIPAICVAWGMLLNPIIATAPDKVVVRIWLTTHILVGMVVGFIAWVVHARFIKKYEKHFPFLGPKIAAASQDNK